MKILYQIQIFPDLYIHHLHDEFFYIINQCFLMKKVDHFRCDLVTAE